jgi:hypothetical protein
MLDTAFDWMSDRVCEPSSWAAVSAALIGLGIVLDISALVVLGMAGAAMAIVLREKGKK